MRPQTEINDFLQQLISTYAGTRTDYYGYAGECLSLAKRWVDVLVNGHLNGQMQAPASSDGWGSGYWSSPPSLISELFNKQAYDPNATYPAGSLFTNARTHHIGILLDNQPGQPSAFVFHQNANPDGSAAHTGPRAKANIDGILVLKVAAPAPVNPIRSYQPTEQKVWLTNLQPTYWWNMNGTTMDINSFHPAAVLDANTEFTVGGYAHHINDETYAMSPDDFNRAVSGDMSTNNGINIKDLREKPVPVVVTPYVPPAPKLEAKPVEYYDLKTTVVYFNNAEDAKFKHNAVSVLLPKSYILVASDEQARKLVKSNQDTQAYWINDNDNVVETIASPTLPVDITPPVSTPVDVAPPPVPVGQGSVQKLKFDMIKPIMLRAINTTPLLFKDLENHNNQVQAQLNPQSEKEYSMVTYKNGEEYYIPTLSMKRGWRHGIPVKYLELVEEPFLDYNHNGQNDLWEFTDKAMQFVETYGSRTWQGASKLLPIVHNITTTDKAVQAKAKVGRFIDGFSSKRKVK